MMLDEITPVILTYNEAPNIGRTLDRILWANRIVVIDSGSTDETLQIVKRYPQVEVISKRFKDCASQWNFANSQVEVGWILSLDADYELSDALVAELRSIEPSPTTAAYSARFVYRIFGYPLRGSLYPPRIVLYRNECAYYRNKGHTQDPVITGPVEMLSGVIFHDDRKPLARWFASQRRYAEVEAEYLVGTDPKSLRWVDRLRLAGWPAPLGVFVYTLVVKGCLFDGWQGWYYALQRLLAEVLIALEIIDRRLRGRTNS
jgi:glycosyltransferase involved in cell wall biosynthesis